jgi:pyruvate ferredoxin oxidoreductase beta subunit
MTCEMGRMAVDTCAWPLYEVVNGQYKVTKPKEKKPILEWLKLQGRFRHLFRPENKSILDDIQVATDRNWEELLRKESCVAPTAPDIAPTKPV